MFNVCPGCGKYREDRIVDAVRDISVCPECGHEQPFKRLPLYVVTGASGCGKSTVLLNLAGSTSDFVCLDSDILWRDEFNTPNDNYLGYRNLWMRMVKNISQAGRPVALFGSATPGQFEQCVERRYLGDIHYLALVCTDEEIEKRLKARPGWRNSGSAENISSMKQVNRWLMDNAPSCGMQLVDTTNMTVAESTAATLSWLQAV